MLGHQGDPLFDPPASADHEARAREGARGVEPDGEPARRADGEFGVQAAVAMAPDQLGAVGGDPAGTGARRRDAGAGGGKSEQKFAFSHGRGPLSRYSQVTRLSGRN